MFQENITREWRNNRPVVIEIPMKETSAYYVVFSAELVTEPQIRVLRELTPDTIKFVFPDYIKKALRLPSLNAFLVNSRSTFEIMGNLAREVEPSRSISISVRSAEDHNTSTTQAETIFELVRFYNEFEMAIDQKDHIVAFRKRFTTPGSVELRFSSRNLLKTSLAIENYLIALTELHGIPPMMVYAELREFGTGKLKTDSGGMVTENATKIKNLWRAFKKVKASELAQE